MSYILDALRKADAERERDPARGIHAHPTPVVAEPSTGMQPAVVAGIVLAAVAVTALVWWLWPRNESGVADAATSRPQVTQPIVQAEIQPPAPRQAPPQAVVAAAAVRAPAAMPSSAAAGATPATPASPASPASPAIPAAQEPAAKPPAAAPSERIVTFAELPADVQQGLPKLPISGGVYSHNASQRMLLVGGQLATEGTEVAPGLVLEQIRPKSAVLRFRGWRYVVDF
ncbi:MAG TPA: general secretion pathway protein GspB [Ramlibacter sp.]|uniref:general secretion pathway protein GspB n=1 Tax=Ramlibacter sp. TaxID=1917967 RepID=UPI002B9CE548|nr:general secretion pathway protein GspB [Ramlibacter sp.]HVZ44342.1 general secretion pathway protein GspB [Ramlibacter sp.]